MCGIVAYLGQQNAYEIIIKGLQRLEYRGYDSAGIALHQNGEINVFKQKGKVNDLQNFIADNDTKSSLGIGHTRWATHGLPNDINAHPHQSGNKKISLVHNGIIENHLALKEMLKKDGFKFSSQTDTEVIAHLIQLYIEKGKDFDSAVISTIAKLKGAYALGVLDKNNPDTLIGVRQQSPLVIGEGFDKNLLLQM